MKRTGVQSATFFGMLNHSQMKGVKGAEVPWCVLYCGKKLARGDKFFP